MPEERYRTHVPCREPVFRRGQEKNYELLPAATIPCKRASLRHIIPFPAAQGLPAEVPARGRPCVIDCASPRYDPAVSGLLPAQVPAGSIGKEETVSFLKTPFTEVMELVRFALPDQDNRKPAAALATAAAGAVPWGRRGRSHRIITGDHIKDPPGIPGLFQSGVVQS